MERRDEAKLLHRPRNVARDHRSRLSMTTYALPTSSDVETRYRLIAAAMANRAVVVQEGPDSSGPAFRIPTCAISIGERSTTPASGPNSRAG